LSFVSLENTEKDITIKTQLKTLEKILVKQINKIDSVLNEKNNSKNNLFTTDQIYSVIENYIVPNNKEKVKKILENLIKR
jgi:hypothetical protein